MPISGNRAILSQGHNTPIGLYSADNVTETIAETVVARKLETTWQEVLDSIHPHPTMSEGIKDAVEVALGEAIHL